MDKNKESSTLKDITMDSTDASNIQSSDKSVAKTTIDFGEFNIAEKALSFKDQAIRFIPRLIMSLIIFLLFSTLASYVRDLIISDKRDIISQEVITSENSFITETNETTDIIIYNIASICYYVINFFGIIFAVTNLGVQVPTILTILGTFIVGIGLSLQNTISNIWAGLYISFNKLFKIGDTIKINQYAGKDFVGKVKTFNLFSTVIIDKETNAPIVIPNLQIQNNFVTNFSGLRTI